SPPPCTRAAAPSSRWSTRPAASASPSMPCASSSSPTAAAAWANAFMKISPCSRRACRSRGYARSPASGPATERNGRPCRPSPRIAQPTRDGEAPASRSTEVRMETLTSLFDAKGCPLEKQKFTWREMASKPISKLDDDAFTRVRIILMNGIETDALRLKNIGARFHGELRQALAQVRRCEQHQATMVNWLLSADHSPLETTVAYEQVAIEVTAAVAQTEPDPYQAQTYRFGLLEDFDHLYRYSA